MSRDLFGEPHPQKLLMHYFHQSRFQPNNSSGDVMKIIIFNYYTMQISHHPSHQELLCSPHSEGSKVDCTPILNRHLALTQTQLILQRQLYTQTIQLGLCYFALKQTGHSFTETMHYSLPNTYQQLV